MKAMMLGTSSGKGLGKGGCRLIRIVKSRPTPLDTTLSHTLGPIPTTSPILNHTSLLCNLYVSRFSSLRIQTLVFSDEDHHNLM